MQNNRANDKLRQTVKGGVPSPQQSPQSRQQGPITRLFLVVLLDATQSMTPYIQAVLKALQKMLDVLIDGALDPSVGLVIFRDELEGEMPEIYEIGTSLPELQKVLSQLNAIGGGSIPESSLPAIMEGISLLGRAKQGVPRVFLHITDAPPHDPEAGYTARSVLKALKQARVLFFACAPNEEPYRTFANVTGGTLFPLQENLDSETFQDVLMAFAKATVKTVRMAETAISDDVQELLRNTRVNG